ncbi:MAG: peptidylprolyl isomerase [Polyangiales bacterium]
MSGAFGLLKPGDVVGEFEVIEPLAEGGMGAVFVARQTSTGRRRALKVLHPRVVLDAKLRERFLAEARVSAEIGGEHPVDVVACGIDAQRNIPWIAMELLEGETLESRVRRAPLTASECAALFRELGDVLERAHGKGIVHRDLKPENVFLVRLPTSDRGFVSKVLDFGIAAFLSEGRTAATATRAMGTPLWMAPEQYEARGKIRASTDVWSLGLIAFFALTGREFWLSAHGDGASVAALIAEIVAQPIPLASERLRELQAEQRADGAAVIPATRAHPSPLPEGFDAWFARCTARDARLRFETGGEACAALVALLGVDRTAMSSRAAIEKTVPAVPVVSESRESREEPVSKTIAAAAHPDAIARSAKEPAKPQAEAASAPESNAPLYGAVGFIVLGALSVLAWKAVHPPSPSPAVPVISTASAGGATIAGSGSTRGNRIHVAQVLIAHTESILRRPTITRTRDQARAFAATLLQRARSGEDFNALARNHSDDPSREANSGDLGFIVPGQTVEPFERAAFALPVGGISDVVESQYGFHVIKRFE